LTSSRKNRTSIYTDEYSYCQQIGSDIKNRRKMKLNQNKHLSNRMILEFFPKTQEAKLYSGQREPLDLEKSAPYIKPNLKQLKTYTGDYYSDELLTTYKIILKDGKLVFAHKNAPKSSLISVAPDTFTAGWWTIKFQKK